MPEILRTFLNWPNLDGQPTHPPVSAGRIVKLPVSAGFRHQECVQPMAITFRSETGSGPLDGLPSAAPARRQVTLVPGSCLDIESEFGPLLRRRLLVACGLTLFILSLFFISYLVAPAPLPTFLLIQSLHASAVVILIILVALLASPLRFHFLCCANSSCWPLG